jgi:hypothetical protein
VTKLIAQGRLVLTADGKRVEVAASNKRLEDTKRVDRQGVREHHARTRSGNGITPPAAAASSPPLAAPSPPATAPSGGEAAGQAKDQEPPGRDPANATQDEYNRARAQKEAAAAAMAEMELRRRQAELVEVGQVRDTAARIAGIIARGFERIGPRIGPVWSVEQDPVKREQLLEDELRKIQQEFADEVAKLGDAGA